MKTPRSFADSTIFTDFPSANVREAIDGWPMGGWQHLSELKGMSHFTNKSQAVRRLSSALSYCERGRLSVRLQRTEETFRPADLAGR